MIRKLLGFIAFLFRLLWRIIDGARRVAFNLVLLVAVAALIVALVRPAPPVPEGAALLVHPSGRLVEQGTIDPSFAFLAGDREEETVLPELLDAVRAARTDPRIKLLVLETDDLEDGGLAKLGELRAAIAEFKAAGKPVLARGERYSQGQYYLASVADEVHLAPDGYALLPGFAHYPTYFGGALATLGIKIHVFRAGEYKSAVEPLTRSDMSEEDRGATRALLDGLWGHFRADIVAARKLDQAKLDNYINAYQDALEAAQGDSARAAQDAGLVDHLSNRGQWRAAIGERLGDAGDDKDFRHIGSREYLAAIRRARPEAPARIAVLVAQGAIVDGAQPPGDTGGDSLARLIREARNDDRVKAVVMRLDSPGGSAWASEVVRAELELTRQAGKPVVASMSSVAASGGYWIAAGADEIFAEPTTITGSIGVFGMFPEFAEPMKRLGLTVDGVATGPFATALDPRLPLSPHIGAALQRSTEHTYRRFLDLVAQARKMKPEEVDRIARGRVWSGAEAARIGLVDHLGGIGAAIEAAAGRAGLKDYTVVWPTPQIPPMRQLLQQFLAAGDEAAAPSPASRVIDRFSADLKTLTSWNDPRHIYTHCLCEAP
ncbi:MAG: signal peptide peptidase SppA [Azoarcus sp.]|jgi:protease-4|nr:signal peptide peptidase SppA [Azoarcus sp.]